MFGYILIYNKTLIFIYSSNIQATEKKVQRIRERTQTLRSMRTACSCQSKIVRVYSKTVLSQKQNYITNMKYIYIYIYTQIYV